MMLRAPTHRNRRTCLRRIKMNSNSKEEKDDWEIGNILCLGGQLLRILSQNVRITGVNIEIRIRRDDF